MAKFIRYCLIASAVFCFLVGNIFNVFNIMLLSILFMLSANVVYSLEDIKRRFFFLVFNFVMFIFLIGRPTINMIEGRKWWMIFDRSHVYFAMYALFLTLVCMFIGAVIAEAFLWRKKITSLQVPKKKIYNIRKIEY